MSTIHELSSSAKDAFVVLSGAIEIKYRDGDVWKAEEGEAEHPVVNRLRAASLSSLIDDPSATMESLANDDLASRLREERRANDNMREFLIELEQVLEDAGKPKDVAGKEVLTWLRGRLSATAS